MGDQIRHIAHFDLDTFFVSVERLNNSSLLGVPVIVGGGDRGVVAACSYEARAFGVHSAQPMKMARYLCPQAIIISGDYDQYSKYSRLVTEVIADTVPVYEKASIDEFYMDLSGMDRFFGTWKFTDELRAKITKETGLPITFALATNKLVSKVATNEVKPSGKTEVAAGLEKSYLAPLKIEKMPGIGEKTAGELHDLGVRNIKTLSEIPVKMLAHKFGKNGMELSRRANGIDESPVVPFHEQKSISKERTFTNDTIDIEFLNVQLVKMIEELGFELRDQGKLTGCVTVKLRYSDFNTYTKQLSIPYTSSDDILIGKVKEIFKKLYERRLLVRLIGVKYTDLVAGHHQIDLFGDSQEMIRLYQSMDQIKKKYGADKIMRAIGTEKFKR